MFKKISIPIIIILSALIFCIILFWSDTGDLPVIKAAAGDTGSFAVYTGDGDILYANRIEEIKKTLSSNIVVKTDNF
ncbi:MAG: hypothetical protein PHS15_01435, partial [Clostridiaceae bacterium]|nr:hypothetical protein [Clostridiaceae bacterium]